MSCQFKPIAKIDLKGVKNQLASVKNVGEPGLRYDDSSGSHKSLKNEIELPLYDQIISLSPSGEFLAIAQNRNLSILSAKWDSQEEDDVKTKYKVTWAGCPCQSEREKITAVMCLPLIMANKSSRSAHAPEQCSLDWTCIAVGFSSGHLRFYDEGGGLLLSEQIYDQPITYLKCQSYHPSKSSSYDDYSEELYVILHSTVAIIPGFALFQTLRACRNQLARVKANFSENFSPPPLTLKKWAFVDQDKMRDCEVIGASSSDLFDHLMTASICGGFNTCYRSGPPKSTLLIATGKGPFVGFHHALEGVEGRSVLTDVAEAVKSKFKGLFRSSVNDRQKSAATIEAPDSLACRFGLCDFNREADHIVRSPNREYSAVTDALGRVTVINNLRGIAIRMWKGYRNAQCGWLQAEEEEPSVKGNPKHLLRTVLFLIIYDPKKGVLEVWTIPNGIRIAAFSCSKRGRLLYTSHGLVGLSNFAIKWANKSSYPCVFVDPEGTVFQVVVPFHCALSDSTSERAADLALLRKLKSILREAELEEEQLAGEVGLIAAELKTMEVRKQMLTMLISNKHVSVDALEAALAVFMDKVTFEDPNCLDATGQSLLLCSQQLRNVLGLYKFVHQQQQMPPNYSSVVPQQGISDLLTVCDVLTVSERELCALKSLMSLLDSPVNSNSTSTKRELHVTFDERTSSGSSLVDYLACFDLGKKSSGASAPNNVTVKKLSISKRNSLAQLLFQGILYSDIPIEVWQAEAACSGILPSDLLQLAVQFWLNKNNSKALEVEMIRFSEVIKAICLLEEVNNYDLSSFWSSVRSMLVESHQPFNALTAALVCRAVALFFEKHSLKKHSKSPKKAKNVGSSECDKDCKPPIEHQNITKDSKVPEDGETSSKAQCRKSSSEWENVSWNSVKWDLLLGRLEDVALLDLLLSRNPAELCDGSENTSLPCLRYEKPIISFSSLLQKGKGSVSEQVAKWLTCCGIDPKFLIENFDLESMDRSAQLVNSPSCMEVDEPGPEDKSEENVREGIPLATEKGTEASSVGAPHVQILNTIFMLKKHFPYSLCGSALVANISWELLLEWHRGPEHINILSAAVQYLETVPNVHVRQGLSSLMWSSHLRRRFETTVQIVRDSNGNPKEKTCQRELQMSDGQLVDFVGICIKFIELFIEASNTSEVIHPPAPEAIVNRSEDLWDYEEHLPATITPSLTNLALMQPQASFDQLHLLHQLARTMHMILSLGLKGQQLLPLFRSAEWSTFFSDNAQAIHNAVHPSDETTNSRRIQFLMRVVTGAMQNIISSDPSHLADVSSGLCSEMSTAMQWMGQCQELAYTWQLSMDPLRRHQVCLLYSSGHDRLAEEILPAVNELDRLAQELLLITGQRLKLIMNNSSDIMEEISNLDPILTTWLYELNTQGVRQVSLSDTALLATHVVQHLPEDHAENLLAVELFDALQALSSSKIDE